MKFLRAFVFLLLAACASGPGRKNLHPEYTKDIVPVSGAAVSANRCRAPGEREISWKDQLLQANACWVAADWPSLRAWGQKLIEEHPQSPWGMFYLSAVEMNGNLPLALWLIERSRRLAPGSAPVLLQKARILWRQGEENQAVRLVEDAVKADGRLVEGFLFLGKVALRNLQKEQAVAYFQRVLRIDATNAEASKILREISGSSMIVGQRIKKKSREDER